MRGHNKSSLAPIKRTATLNALTLLATEWRGENALYAFQRADGTQFECTVADLRNSVRERRALERKQRALAPDMAEIAAWSGRTGVWLQEASAAPSEPLTWSLPDGTRVTADWPIMKNVTNAILRRKAYFAVRALVMITAEDCAELRHAVLARQQREAATESNGARAPRTAGSRR